MEQRRFPGNIHWYHETQSTRLAHPGALMPGAARITDCFLLDLLQQVDGELKSTLLTAQNLYQVSHDIYQLLLPEHVTTSQTHTLTLYDRICTALTVAQVTGIQRLCNHYAARLAPLECPDSSRESHRRLAQITEYARQLASQPTLINAAVLQHLSDVGLTLPDIISFHQIIGFVCYQARVIAGIHAMMALPVRWIPGTHIPPDAENIVTGKWHPTLTLPELHAVEQRHPTITSSQPDTLTQLLACNNEVLEQWQVIDALLQRKSSPAGSLATAVAARINGSSHCFWHYPAGTLRDALQHSVDQATDVADTQQKAVILLAAQLTRSPERFSAAHLQPLRDTGLSDSEIFDIVLIVAAANWSNRLVQGLGTVTP